MKITHTKFSTELSTQIFKCLSQHALEIKGIEGVPHPPEAFTIENENKLIAAIVIHIFWGQLHIKFLVVESEYRHKGLGTQLVEHALAYGKKLGCQFAYLETMDFQAPIFYENLGFITEFVREGYSHDSSIYYMRKFL